MTDSSNRDFRYDVFLSYRRKEPDQSWVRKELDVKLTEAGLRVCIDVKNFLPGRNFFLEMDRAKRESRQVLCVMSPAYFEGNRRMTMWEALAAKGADPAGIASTLVPLMLRQTDVPTWMEDIIYADWTDESHHELEWQKLLGALNAPKRDVGAPAPVGAAERQEERLRGHGNYVMISTETPFTEELRQLLLAARGELGIEKDLYGERAQTFEDYRSGLFEFLDDPHPEARWLFTVQPEDKYGRLSQREEIELLDGLDRTGKGIVFFESGLEFLKYDPECRKKNVVVIRTDYENAVRDLIRFQVVEFVRKSPRPQLVTLFPSNSVADVRRRIYNEFLAGLQYNYGLTTTSAPAGSDHPFRLDSSLDLSMKMLRITSLTVGSWYEDDAAKVVRNFCDAAPSKDNSFDICFLCGNDEIALGARQAELELHEQNPVVQRRVAFVGFDGIPKMIELIRAGLDAATMRVNLKEICKQAIRVVRSPATLNTCEILVSAQGIYPMHGGRAAWGP
jgi:hypothetical protein